MNRIVRLSEFTSEDKDKFIKKHENLFLRPTQEFDECGLRFPLKYLNSLKKSVIFFPIELMAEYADVVTTNCINKGDKDFEKHMFQDLQTNPAETYWDNINSTAIGNMAYTALYSKNDTLRSAAEQQLIVIFNKHTVELKNQSTKNKK